MHPPQHLAKLLAYILGRRPDEFGLVTDSDGFVKIKDLLKVFTEEEGLRYVRRGHLEEILVTLPEPPVEMLETRIRAKDRAHLKPYGPAETLPKLLYTSIRRKAHPVVFEKGISPAGDPFVVLSSEVSMAERIGRRNDASPVVLTVSVAQCIEKGVRFLAAEGDLFLADYVPVFCFTGPPLPKEREFPAFKDKSQMLPAIKQPGSFFPDLADPAFGSPGGKRDRKGTRPEWKRDRKRMIRTEKKKGSRF